MEPTTESFSMLALATQYSFYMAFSGMFAATIYFWMERNNLTPRYSVVASLSMMITCIAAVNYASMRNMVGLDGSFATLGSFPTEFRYADWVLTTPLILAVLVMLSNSQNKGALAAKLMIADAIMIVAGYIGEVDINRAGGGTTIGWVGFLVGCAAFVYILVTVYGELSEAAADMPDELRGTFSALQNFVLIAWSIYPLGYLAPLLGYHGDLLALRELIYCIADITAKAGFGILAVSLAKKLSMLEIQRQSEQHK
ncbi:MAG: bacteriorhodopsin [Alphaproteobacteria bacterium]|nr:bacteriorhodopsin [Alphaproteobacteria bacterium]